MDKPADAHLEDGGPALDGYRIVHIDPVVEKRLLRKTDRVLIPLVFAAYLFGFLDRSNIGNAQTAGMGEDLGFNDAQFQWLLTIFYIPYIAFEWMAIFWKIVPPHTWACITVLVWGLASTLQAAAFNWQGLMACRFFLAAAEAAFSPGVPYLLSFFYQRHELGLRCGVFLSAAPLATTFAGALAYAITSSNTALAGWRLLFLVEGLPTIAIAVVLYFALPDAPDTARFLNAEEREVACVRALRQTGVEGRARLGTGFGLGPGFGLGAVRERAVAGVRVVGETLAQPQTLVMPLMFFSCNVSFASLPVFLPTVLTSMGFAHNSAQGLTVPPYLVAFFVCIATTYASDRLRQRGLVVAALSVIGGIGYVVLAAVPHAFVPRYIGIILAAAGIFPAIANILPWVLNNQRSDTRRGVAIALLNLIGQCGPILGTRLFPTSDGPVYSRGMAICAAFMFFNALLALLLRQYLVIQNRRLEQAEAEAAAAEELPELDKKGRGHADAQELDGTVGYRYFL